MEEKVEKKEEAFRDYPKCLFFFSTFNLLKEDNFDANSSSSS